MKIKTLQKPLMVGMAACALNVPLHAAQLEEVIITAERKETNLQQTPVAVSAMTASDMDRLQITEVNDIDINVPGMSIETNIASSTAVNILMRGSSEPNAAFLFSEPGIGLYLNGVYRRLSAGNIELADIERIEVARGPQGTLFGRNTLAGAVNVVTRKPTAENYADISISYDTFDTTYVKGVVGGGLSETVSASLSAVYRDRAEGPFENKFNNKDVGRKNFLGFQGNLVWNFSDDGELFVSVYNSEDDSDGAYGSPLNVTTGEFVFSSPDVFAASSLNGGVEPFSTADQSGFDTILTLPVNDSVTFKYIASYNETESSWGIDFTSGAVAGPSGCAGLTCISAFYRISDGEQEQFSHEFQLLGENGSFDWIVGAYYFEEETLQVLQDEFSGFQPFPATYDLNSDSQAIFGQASYSVNNDLTLTVGGRYTEDNKNFSGSIGGVDFTTDPSWDEFTGKLGIDYQLNDDILLYLSWSQGFKAGTFNAFAPAGVIETPLEPESVDSTEIGFKGMLFDNSIRLNVALFNAAYEELVVGGLGSGGLSTTNGGETTVRGLELESTWVITDSFSTFLTLNYLLDYEWDDTSGSLSTRVGDELPYARELQWTVGANYNVELGNAGSISFNLLAHYDGEYYTVATHQKAPIELIDDRTVVNLGVVYTSANASHQVFLNGSNVTDTESYFRVANFSFLPTNTALVSPHEPATWELGYKYSF